MKKEQTTKVSALDNLRVVEKIYADYKTGDLESILSNMDEDIVWTHPGADSGIPFAGIYTGKQQIRQFFDIAVNTIEVVRLDLLKFVAERDNIIVVGFDHMRVKKTGREYQTNWVHVYTFKAGKIFDFEQFTDTAAMARAFSTAND